MKRGTEITPDEFFSNEPLPQQLFACVSQAVHTLGETSIRATKSQITFRRRRPFAWVWMPGRYLKGRYAPLVLTIALPEADSSPRWKEIVEPAPGHFIHHLELQTTADVDEEVSGWLRTAWEAAG